MSVFLVILTSVNSLMLRVFACFATFFFASSRAAAAHWPGPNICGLLAMDCSDSRDDSVPMLDRAAVTVASGDNRAGQMVRWERC